MSKANQSVLVTICARGGSKGVPGKNIRHLHGRPLIAYTIETALSCAAVDQIVISTDSQQIANVVETLGIKVPFLRPPELATDNAPKARAILHAVQFVEITYGFFPDIVLDLDVGAPLRKPEDINTCVDRLCGDPDLDAVVTIYEAERNPYFNMVEVIDGRLQMVKTGHQFVSRQQAPTVFSVSGSVFGWKRTKLETVTHLYEGRWGGCIIPKERAIDIDFEIDFQFVEFLMGKQNRLQPRQPETNILDPA